MIELKDLLVGAGSKHTEHALSVAIDDGNSVLFCGSDAHLRHALIFTLCGLQPSASGYVSYKGEWITAQSAPFLRRLMHVGYVPATTPSPHATLREMAHLHRAEQGKRALPSEEALIDLWQQGGIEVGLIDTPSEAIDPTLVQVALTQEALWLQKRVVLAEEVGSEEQARWLQRMTAEGRLVIATASDDRYAAYFDNKINLEEK